MASGAPAPPNFQNLTERQANAQNQQVAQQTQSNRPNQSNPFASLTWGVGPDGRPVQTSQFNGQLAGANSALQQQASSALGTPLDFGGVPGLTSGEDARNQAITSAYGQATSRLDPQFSQKRGALQTQLLNQGLQPGSTAYDRAMGNLGIQENDAYSQAMANAIGQGTSAGSALFNQSLQGRQQGINEILQQREQPLADLGRMQGLLGQQGFSQAGLGVAPQYLQAGGMQNAADLNRYQMNQQQLTDIIGAGTQLAGTAGSLFALSDERAKVDIQQHGMEVLPGVPLLTFRYHPEAGQPPGLYAGVSAQHLQKVAPQHVRARKDGLLEVSQRFAPRRLTDE
jgi:hypothetical protein